MVGNAVPIQGQIGWRADPASGNSTPVISLVSVGSTQAAFSVVDPIACIFFIDTYQTGCVSSVGSYSQGQKTPVSATFTKTGSGTCFLDIDAVNALGLYTRFDPVLMSIGGASSLQPGDNCGTRHQQMNALESSKYSEDEQQRTFQLENSAGLPPSGFLRGPRRRNAGALEGGPSQSSSRRVRQRAFASSN